MKSYYSVAGHVAVYPQNPSEAVDSLLRFLQLNGSSVISITPAPGTPHQYWWMVGGRNNVEVVFRMRVRTKVRIRILTMCRSECWVGFGGEDLE